MSDNRFRTKLCRNFALGHCAQGERCKYLHSTNIPVSSSTFTSSQPVTQQFVGMHNGFSPSLFSPYNTTFTGYPWAAAPSPTAPNPEVMQFNWTYTSPPPQAQPQAVNPPNPPQFRPLSWRTTLCRHYSKNQGWCPLGDECGYIHDLALSAHASDDIRFLEQRGDARSKGGNAKGRAGSKHSHCWAYVQGLCRVKDCPYLHPAAVNLFIPHTPCLAWPNCTRGVLCAYKHPEPLPQVPEYHSSRPVQFQPPQPPSPVLIIPPGSVQFHGTTYFPYAPGQQPPPYPLTHMHHPAPPLPPPPPPPPPAQSSPHYAWTYSPLAPSVPSGYSPYSPESIPFHSPYYEYRSTLPPVSIAGPLAGPAYEENHMYPGMRPPVSVNNATGSADPEVIQNVGAGMLEEFPYQPPAPARSERLGHARRYSVTLKSKDDSDALGLTTQGVGRRESWMGHSQRDGPTHRSWPWAPDATGIPQHDAAQKPELV